MLGTKYNVERDSLHYFQWMNALKPLNFEANLIKVMYVYLCFAIFIQCIHVRTGNSIAGDSYSFIN